jgi:dihydropteroate synthase
MTDKTTSFQIVQTINCRGRLLDLSKPVVMGILNCTPDSFYDGQQKQKRDDVVYVERMIAEGAMIIDIGGQSTRPGAIRMDADAEWLRIRELLSCVRRLFPDVFISCDTFYASVAQRALDHGADIINDISFGKIDDQLLNVVARYKAPYVLMHMQGEPSTMQLNPEYTDVVDEVYTFLLHAKQRLQELGITEVIIDPGFGFGKSVAHNYSLLKHLPVFRLLGLPILVGLSRKRMITNILNITPVDALNGTTALNMLALQQGASVLRVHDVKEAIQTIKLRNAFDAAV